MCKHDPVDIVYNFQKAFDKVSDHKLLRKQAWNKRIKVGYASVTKKKGEQ